MTRVVLVTPFPVMSDGLIILLSVVLVNVKRRIWMGENSNHELSQSSAGVRLWKKRPIAFLAPSSRAIFILIGWASTDVDRL